MVDTLARLVPNGLRAEAVPDKDKDKAKHLFAVYR